MLAFLSGIAQAQDVKRISEDQVLDALASKI